MGTQIWWQEPEALAYCTAGARYTGRHRRHRIRTAARALASGAARALCIPLAPPHHLYERLQTAWTT